MKPPDDLGDSEYLPDPSAVRQHVLDTTAKPLKQSTLTFGRTSLATLNPAQREAVTAPRTGGVAVLAGPGSGKTKVLTTRVAWLIQEAGVKPEELVYVPFPP
jgi:DNA helicase IV